LGRRRLVALGPKARAIVERYLDRPPQAYLFSPAEVAEWRAEHRRRERPARRTPLYPCEARRVQREKLARRRRQRRRAPGERYDSNTYYRAIGYGIRKANKGGVVIPSWHPNQLRHSRATEVRRQYGLEAAQVVLGHAKADVTQVYAERDLERAKEIARKTG
jgi:site-specific recombinase XerD